jgi:hypothetical protein
MSSPARIEANRKNARRSTGPRTPEGRMRSSQNALRHGLTARTIPVTAVERAQDWRRHRGSLWIELQPVGYLEEILVDEIAMILWRLKRVPAFEVGRVLLGQLDVPKELLDGFTMNEVEMLPAVLEATASMLVGLPQMSETDLISREAVTGLFLVLEKKGLDLFSRSRLSSNVSIGRTYAQGPNHWTAQFVTEVLKTASLSYERDTKVLTGLAQQCIVALQADLNRVQRRLDGTLRAHQLSALIPSAEDSSRIVRYEGHLHRLLAKDLRELQALQARRKRQAGVEPALPETMP